jgi:hypothetical protein
MRDSLSTIEIRLPQEKPTWASYTALAISLALLAAEIFGLIHALGRILGRLP